MTTTAYVPNPGYAVVPSPRPRQPASDLTLTALHTAIRFSGLFAKFTAQRWGLRPLADAAERVAAELIARAVETTGNPDPNPRYTELGELRIIGIRVSQKGHGLLVEVWDSDPKPPQNPDSDGHLSAVANISQQWNCYPIGGGKVIWTELIPRHTQLSEPLPHRAGGQFSYPKPDVPTEALREVQAERPHTGVRA